MPALPHETVSQSEGNNLRTHFFGSEWCPCPHHEDVLGSLLILNLGTG